MGLLAEAAVSQAVEGGASQGKRRAWSIAGLENQARDPPQGSRVWASGRARTPHRGSGRAAAAAPLVPACSPDGPPKWGTEAAGLGGASLG